MNVMRQLRSFWRDHPTPGRFQTIKISMFAAGAEGARVEAGHDARYPYLKGRAAEVKHLVRALEHVFRMNMPATATAADRFVYQQIALMMRPWKAMDTCKTDTTTNGTPQQK